MQGAHTLGAACLAETDVAKVLRGRREVFWLGEDVPAPVWVHAVRTDVTSKKTRNCCKAGRDGRSLMGILR